MATKIEEGSYFTEMASLLFSAFTLEAYLNHLGEKLFEYWKELDRLPYYKKLTIITTHLKIKPDYKGPPYSTIEGLFRFRNSIAHGRSKILSPDPIITDIEDDPHNHERPSTEWEEYCNLKNVNAVIEDVKKVIEELHQKAGFGTHPMEDHGITSRSMRLLIDEH